ncbi:MAG: hypothetical protein QM817_28555 [Archangium sp.]
MLLDFTLPQPSSLERVRALFETMAATLSGRPVSFTQESKVSTYDPNHADGCFDAKWRDGDLTFTESISGADGNPRDGYGYYMALTLEVGGVKKLSASGFSSSPAPDVLNLTLTSTAGDWLRLRELMRREVGVERDRCLTPLIIRDVAKALSSEGQLDTALSLARECLARSAPTDYAREELVAWLAANDVMAGGPSMRAREAPMVLDAWLELERGGDTTLGETFARLCPFDRARWPAAPWFAHPLWPLERGAPVESEWFTVHLSAGHVRTGLVYAVSHELTAWEWPKDWSDVSGETVKRADGWSWHVSRMAKFREVHSTHPTVQVSLLGMRAEGTNFVGKVQWSWIPGVESGDVLLIVEQELPRPGAITFTAVGSAAFRQRAEEVVRQLTRLRWHRTSVEDSLTPWKPHAQTRFLEADVRSAVRAALLATMSADQVAEIEKLIDEKKESDVLWRARDGVAHSSPLERARSKALSAAANLIAGDEAEVRRILELVDLELVQFAEFVHPHP